ncbi:RidA family protein [Pararhizobium sp. YC-54]|uniref:RidA family protein n=1 Tax=Pararhizobium sp. YC-54 TaxID=2986920 RepID=UPI0021F7014E|nr:RidA family protein [Pararhizobium sp. YC-54]MCV9999269.1 RidA family protein [Pararhizobium sp. YC-54]
MTHKTLHPEGWVAAKGYSNGVLAQGRTIYTGGMIGWNSQCQFETDDFIAQVEQTLRNIVAVLAEGGAGPQHLVRLTWYVTSKAEYLADLKALGRVYKDVIGRHYPAMAVVEVSALMEDRAKVEIEATAVVSD